MSTKKLSDIIDEVVRLTGDDGLYKKFKTTLDKHAQIIEQLKKVRKTDEIEDILKKDEMNLNNSILQTRHICKAIEHLWTEQTEFNIAQSNLKTLENKRTLEDLRHTLQQLGIDEPFSEKEIDVNKINNSLSQIRRSVLGCKLSVLRSNIRNLERRVNTYHFAKFRRVLKYRSFDFVCDLGFILIVFFLSLPIGGFILSIGITIVGWAVGRFLFIPWLNRQLFQRKKENTIRAINSFYFTLLTVHCYVALLNKIIHDGHKLSSDNKKDLLRAEDVFGPL